MLGAYQSERVGPIICYEEARRPWRRRRKGGESEKGSIELGWSFVIAREEEEEEKLGLLISGHRPRTSTWAFAGPVSPSSLPSIVNLMSLATRRCPVNDSMRGLTAVGWLGLRRDVLPVQSSRTHATAWHDVAVTALPAKKTARAQQRRTGGWGLRKSHASSSFVSHHFQLCNHANWRAGPCLQQSDSPAPGPPLGRFVPPSRPASLYLLKRENPSQSKLKMIKTLFFYLQSILDPLNLKK